MKRLTAKAKKILSEFDRTANEGKPNTTRRYLYLVPNGQDMEIRTVAMKVIKGKLKIKDICQCSVDSPVMLLKDVSFVMIGGYVVDWSPEGGRDHGWTYEGKWGKEPYNRRRSMWKMNAPVVNPEVLLEHERFKYCAWRPECGHILDYLKTFVEHPKVELLSKMDLGWLSGKRTFLLQLEKNKALAKFVMENREVITAHHYGVDIIRMAFNKKIPMIEAKRRIENIRYLTSCGIPAGVNRPKALEYINHNLIEAIAYARYIRNCVQLKLDLKDTKVSFPIKFKERSRIIQDTVLEEERKKDEEIARLQDVTLAKYAKKFIRFEKVKRNGLMIVIPKKTSDFIDEGKQLHNCLGHGHYAAKMARGDSLVAFIRASDKPKEAFVAVDYDLRNKIVTQCYAANNQKPDQPVLDFVDQVFTKRIA